MNWFLMIFIQGCVGKRIEITCKMINIYWLISLEKGLERNFELLVLEGLLYIDFIINEIY